MHRVHGLHHEIRYVNFTEEDEEMEVAILSETLVAPDGTETR